MFIVIPKIRLDPTVYIVLFRVLYRQILFINGREKTLLLIIGI